MQSFFLFLFIKNIKSTNYLCRNQASQGLDKIRHTPLFRRMPFISRKPELTSWTVQFVCDLPYL